MAEWKSPRRLKDCVNIDDLRSLAMRRVPGPIFHYLDGGAESEFTMRRNSTSFDDVRLVPRCLVDVSEVSTKTKVLGQEISFPLICSPAGASRLYDADGELAAARAAAKAEVLYTLSTMSTISLEDVAEAGGRGPKMLQLYIFKDRAVTRHLIERCKVAGYDALCLTVDAAAPGKRERDLRTGFGGNMHLNFRMLASFAQRPRWLLAQTPKGPISMPNLAALAGSSNFVIQSRFAQDQLSPKVSWDDVGELIEMWGGPFAIKGVMAADDARRCVDVGASAVIISNHGGRQLDGAASPFEVLPAIADAVGNRIEIILDGGVRRGTHILKALAKGATACSVGRPYLYGLSAGGQAGVGHALEILCSELKRAMQLSGITDLAQINDHIISAV